MSVNEISESRYKNLLEEGQRIGSIGSWEYDVQNDKLMWSDEIYRIFEIEPHEFKATYDAFLSFVHPEDIQMVMESYETANQQKSQYGPLIHRIITSKGTLKHVEEKGFTDFNKHGEPVRTYGIVRDITKERIAELELEKKTNYIESIINSLPDLIFISDIDGVFLDARAGQQNDYYVTPADFFGKHYSEILPDRIVKQLDISFDKLRQGEKVVSMEYDLQINQSLHYYDARLTFFSENEVVMVVRDITNLRQTLAQMERLNQLKELLARISSTYIKVSEDNLGSAINQSLAELGKFVSADRFYIFRYDFEQMTASNTYEWCAEGVAPQIEFLQNIPVVEMHEWMENHINGRVMIIDNVQQLEEDDAVRMVLDPQGIKSIITMPLMNNGKCTGFVGIDYVKDYYIVSEAEEQLLSLFADMLSSVNHRINTEERLYENQTFLNDIINHSGSIITQKNKDGTYKLVNRKWLTVTGLTESEVIGKTDLQLFPKETALQFMNNDKAVIEQGISIETEEFLETPDGMRYFTSVKFPSRNSHGEIIGLCGLITEITDRKKAEEAEITRKKLEAANQAKSEFLSNVTHEIRTPLNAIVGFSEILDQADSLPKKLEKHVQTIRRSSQHLLNLVNDILDVSRIESGVSKPAHHQFSIRDLMENIRMLFSQQAASKGLELTFSLKNLPEKIISDDLKIRQILVNVIGNAIKFTDKGFVKVSASFHQQTGDLANSGFNSNDLFFTISDSGPGIPEEELHYIYDSFFQVKQGIKEGGTGLGLHITKKLVDVLQGTISAQSKLNEGTVFRISIPVVCEEQETDSEILNEVLQTEKKENKVTSSEQTIDFEPLSAELTDKFSEAISSGDIYKVLELTEELGPAHQKLKQLILSYSERFDYDSLNSILSELDTKNH